MISPSVLETESSFQLSLIEKVVKEGTNKKCIVLQNHVEYLILTILCNFLALRDIYSHF